MANACPSKRFNYGLASKPRGGKRPDLGYIYFRSAWEANYARYLNLLLREGKILGWEYEDEVFPFPVKRGVTEYRPDFTVLLADRTVEIHEVKGYMDRRSRTALKRMAKYHPEEKIVVIDRARYKEIEKDKARDIPEWEW